MKAALGDKYGMPGLPRHLRRRTRSHNPYAHRRRPNSKLQAARQQDPPPGDVKSGGEQMATLLTNRAMRRRKGRLKAQFLESSRWTEASLAHGGSARRQRTAAGDTPLARQALEHGDAVRHCLSLSLSAGTLRPADRSRRRQAVTAALC